MLICTIKVPLIINMMIIIFTIIIISDWMHNNSYINM